MSTPAPPLLSQSSVRRANKFLYKAPGAPAGEKKKAKGSVSNRGSTSNRSTTSNRGSTSSRAEAAKTAVDAAVPESSRKKNGRTTPPGKRRVARLRTEVWKDEFLEDSGSIPAPSPIPVDPMTMIPRLNTEIGRLNSELASLKESHALAMQNLETTVAQLERVTAGKLAADPAEPPASSSAPAVTPPLPVSAAVGAAVSDAAKLWATQKVASLESQVTSLEEENEGLRSEVYGLKAELEGLRLLAASAMGSPPPPTAAVTLSVAAAAAGAAGGAAAAGAVAPDPKLEAQLFAAAGYDVEKRTSHAPRVSELRTLLATHSGLNVNCRDGTGLPPLAHAASSGSEEAILLLVDGGADLDAENLDGATPLHMTIYSDQPRGARRRQRREERASDRPSNPPLELTTPTNPSEPTPHHLYAACYTGDATPPLSSSGDAIPPSHLSNRLFARSPLARSATALLIACGADASAAAQDAGAMGKQQVRDIFAAVTAGGSHPMVEQALERLRSLRG